MPKYGTYNSASRRRDAGSATIRGGSRPNALQASSISSPVVGAASPATRASVPLARRELAAQREHPAGAAGIDLPRLLDREVERDRGRAVDDGGDALEDGVAVGRGQAEILGGDVAGHGDDAAGGLRHLLVQARE